ncbi:flavohemoglobin expression-modulating QEGLA motif protein [Paucihalobacter sp.]|uniref:flavohemoglobin expression-modulating QEGLA motif protein n=1 Tax=Paucihalobacter sp. TaxID=2850405 RepID=UPI002FE37711
MSQIKTTDEFQHLFEIDANLNRLVKNIELLNYINPQNIESEKKQFFSSKYTYEPKLKYPKIKFNGYKLHRLFFSQRLERIQDEDIKQLYEDIIYEYSGLVECIQTIGQGRKFYYNSLKSFGSPTQRSIDNANFILRFSDSEFDEDLLPLYNVYDAKAYFEDFSERYDFNYTVKLSNNLSAAAMVLSNSKMLVLRKNHKFSKNQLKVLANHEIGVHLVTTFNAFEQPLKIFANGFPNNVETQEGLAVYSEFMSGCLTIERLKELSYRVIAVDSLHKGFTFADTFDLLYSQHKLNKDKAFGITLRVHRGGGFTKDHLYLSGLTTVYNYAKNGGDLGLLLTGKSSIEYLETIKKLQTLGLAIKPKHYTDAYFTNDNANNNLEFILKSLK